MISCWSDRPKMWATATLYQYIGLYTRLICVYVEPAQPTPSTAPSLPCETHPAQRPSISYTFLQLKPFSENNTSPTLPKPRLSTLNQLISWWESVEAFRFPGYMYMYIYEYVPLVHIKHNIPLQTKEGTCLVSTRGDTKGTTV